jgi:glycosyltransferase involved in cell wall biosynthesis
MSSVDLIRNRRIVIAVNGFASGNAEPLCRYLLERQAKDVTVIRHPLVTDQRGPHKLQVFNASGLAHESVTPMPFVPPFTYVFDLAVPKLAGNDYDLWIGFNNLNTLRGLQEKKNGRVKKVVYLAIDYTNDRFGRRSPLTWVYNAVDKKCCEQADELWALTKESHEARLKSLKLEELKKPFLEVPMGANMLAAPKVGRNAFASKQIVFLGHIIEKQGVQLVLRALKRIRVSLPSVHFMVMGTGPYLDTVKALAQELGVSDAVTFRGFVESDDEIETVLAQSAVAVAPYNPEKASFTRYADAGKLKMYLGAGLPIVMTDVTINAKQLEQEAGASLINYDEEELHRALVEILNNEALWQQKSDAAKAFGLRYDWNSIFDRAFESSTVFQSR